MEYLNTVTVVHKSFLILVYKLKDKGIKDNHNYKCILMIHNMKKT